MSDDLSKKVIYISRLRFWERSKTGGMVISRRNYQMIVDLYGIENVQGIYIGVDRDEDEQHSEIAIFEEKNGAFKRYKNYLACRFGYSKTIENRVVSEIRKYDAEIIFFDGSWFGGLITKLNENSFKRIIVFYHNVEANVQFKEAFVIDMRPWRLFKYLCVKNNEKIITQKATDCICLNTRDSNMLAQKYGREADFLLPTTLLDIFDDNERLIYECSNTDMPVLLLVGIFFPPNVKGLKWFVDEVMPDINCTLCVVGRGMEKFHVDKNAKNVKVIGEVDNLAEYYYMADAVIEPIFIGDGMKTKTAEALMFGKTIFATDEALEGYEDVSSDFVYRCNSAEDFISNINRHFSSSRNKYNESIRKTFLENYEYHSKVATLNNFLRKRASKDDLS